MRTPVSGATTARGTTNDHGRGQNANPASPAPPAPLGTDRRKWLILAVIAIASLMVILDATVVNIALPSAQKALHFTNSEREWIITAYTLAFGSLLLLGGKLGDLVGRRRTFLIGLIGFALASAVGGAASGFGMLVVARACQGLFAALLTPAEKALLSYPGQQTSVMFGCYLTDDAGNSLGSGSSYPGVFSFSRGSLTTDNELALAAYLKAH